MGSTRETRPPRPPKSLLSDLIYGSSIDSNMEGSQRDSLSRTEVRLCLLLGAERECNLLHIPKSVEVGAPKVIGDACACDDANEKGKADFKCGFHEPAEMDFRERERAVHAASAWQMRSGELDGWFMPTPWWE